MPSRHAWNAIARALGAVVLAGLLVVGVRASRPVVAEGAAPGQITVYLWPAGQGRIDLAQNGANVATCDFRTVIDTSSKCAVDVAAGVPVTLTATAIPQADATLDAAQTAKVPDYPVADPSFVRWTVFGCDGTGPCTYTPEDEDWVGAIFTPLELEVGVVGNGIVVDATDADRLSCDNTVAFPNAITSCHGLYAADSSVVLEATPGLGDTGPATWADGCAPETGNRVSPRCTVTMSNIRTFAAVGFPGSPDGNFLFPFKISPYVRVALGGSGSGRVTGSGFDCGTQCTNALAYQTRVNLDAAADQGSHFVGWQGVCSTNPACSFDAGSATRVKAIFDLSPVTTATPPTVTTTAALSARLQKAVVQRIGGRRVVVATLVVDRLAFATLRLLRNGRSVATTHWNLRTGRTLARLRVPRTLKPGRAQLQVRIVAGKSVRTFTTAVRIGR